MGDAKGVKEDIKLGVLELGAIVTMNMLDLDTIVGHGTIGKSSEDILHFSLIKDYVHPSISRIVINNNETIETSSCGKSGIMSRAE
jgi:hypothetical protein